MLVKEIKDVNVKYFKVESKDNNIGLNETDCFNYYKELGYKVYSDYAFYFRKSSKKQVSSYNQHIDRNELRKLSPVFDKKIYDLFKQYKDGEPDLLVEKDNKWEFIEVKTTSDSLRPNQILFIEKLKELSKVSIHYFLDVETTTSKKKSTPRKDRGKIKDIFNNEYFENELIILKAIKDKKKYKSFYPIAQIYKKCPEYPYNKTKLNLIHKYTGVDIESIKWYYSNNSVSISTDAIRKLTKKSTMSVTDKELLLKHKDIISRNK